MMITTQLIAVNIYSSVTQDTTNVTNEWTVSDKRSNIHINTTHHLQVVWQQSTINSDTSSQCNIRPPSQIRATLAFSKLSSSQPSMLIALMNHSTFGAGFLDPKGGSQRVTLVVVLVGISSLQNPKAFLVCSVAQRNFAYVHIRAHIPYRSTVWDFRLT